jgi:hypothetical protein
METKLNSTNTLMASAERPSLNEILKIIGMKEVTANVFALPTRKKV